MTPWQPIETAPRDGTIFLGCTDKGTFQIIKLNKHLHIWIDADGRESYRQMTYWLPLPDPPNKEQTEPMEWPEFRSKIIK